VLQLGRAVEQFAGIDLQVATIEQLLLP